MHRPKVDIVIVNWNSGRLLYECLKSIRTSRDISLIKRITVVDNASTDGSADCLEMPGLTIELVRNGRNAGFAAACNLGASRGSADYVLFLNPDIRLFDGSLEKPIAFMESPEGADIGIVGIQLVGDRGEILRSCSRFPTPGALFMRSLGIGILFPRLGSLMADWDHGDSRFVDQVMGAFFLIRRGLFERLGGFDERFFVYYEDVDLSFRARESGWHSFYLTETRAYHKGRGTTEQAKAERLFYSLRSRVLYVFKHFSRPAACAVLFGVLFAEPIARLLYGALGRSNTEIGEVLRGYLMLWRSVPTMLKAEWSRGESR